MRTPPEYIISNLEDHLSRLNKEVIVDSSNEQ